VLRSGGTRDADVPRITPAAGPFQAMSLNGLGSETGRVIILRSKRYCTTETGEQNASLLDPHLADAMC